MLSNRLSSRLSIDSNSSSPNRNSNGNNDGNNVHAVGIIGGVGVPASTTRTTSLSSPNIIMLNSNNTMQTQQQQQNQDDGSSIDDGLDNLQPRSLQNIFEISDSSLLSSTRSLNQQQQHNHKTKNSVATTAAVGAPSSFLPSHLPPHHSPHHHHKHKQPNQWCLLFLLNVVAIIWGTQHPVIKIVVDSDSDFGDGVMMNVNNNEEQQLAAADSSSSTTTQGVLNKNGDDVSPALSVLLRFAIAAIISTPTLLLCCYHQRIGRGGENDERRIQQQQPSILQIWRWGFELGVYLTLGFALQAVALTITTAQRSGFLLYLNVKFVPLFGWLLGGKSISKVTWISAMIALVGTALLGLGGQDTVPFNVGDLLAIGSAITSALFIWRLEISSSNLQQQQQQQQQSPPHVGGGGGSSSSSKQEKPAAKTFEEEEEEETFDDNTMMISRTTFKAYESPDKEDEKESKNMMKNQQRHCRHHHSSSGGGGGGGGGGSGGSGKKAAAISALLHSTTMWSVTLGCLIWTVFVQITTNDYNYINVVFPDLIQNHLWEMLYLGTIPTALCNYLQTYVQRFVSSERATLIYSMDPVYGAIASYLLLGETLGSIWGYLGAILIFLASLTGALFPTSSTSSTSSPSGDDGDEHDHDVYAPFLSTEEEDEEEAREEEFRDEPDVVTRRRRRREYDDDAYNLEDKQQQLYDDDLELYPDYHNWIEGWGALIGIGLAIVSFGFNIYAAAVVLLDDDPDRAEDDDETAAAAAPPPLNSRQSAFIVYACLLAASLSLWVTLREMKLVLNGYEEDSWTKYRLLQELAKEEDDHRIRLISRLEVASKREFVLKDAYRQIQRMIPTYTDISTRSTLSNLIQQSKDVQTQRECLLCQELVEQIMEYSVQNNLPILASSGRSRNNDNDDDDDDENWILQYLEQYRPDVTINHHILSKKRKRYYNKSKHKHQSEKRVGLVLILMRDIAQTYSELTTPQPSKKRHKRIIEISV